VGSAHPTILQFYKARIHNSMKVTATNNYQSNIELSDKEIKIMQCIFTEVKSILDHEPEFQTRV
jgi:hypothetical protein